MRDLRFVSLAASPNIEKSASLGRSFFPTSTTYGLMATQLPIHALAGGCIQTQWYYADLQPWVHYVPLEENLSDLVSTLLFLKDNQDIAEQIAQNGLQFAREHINKRQNLLYLSKLLWAYSALLDK